MAGRCSRWGPRKTSVNGNRVDSNYGTIDEWYVNGPGGLEQGFTISGGAGVSPALTNAGGTPAPQSGSLTVELALGGDLTGTVNAAGDGLTLTRPDGSAALGYTGLVAYDATGKTLPAWLEVQAEGGRQDLLIHVDTAGAQGQITIDPFVQQAKLTASDGAANDNFGNSVSVSGNTVVVGAWNAKVGANTLQGAAYVFTAPSSGWANMTQTAKLTASGGAASDDFGVSVSIDGNTVVVGASGAKVGSNSTQGAAYVFVKPASGWANMTQTAKLTASGGAASDNFGVSVSVSGNTVVVGAWNAKVGANTLQGAAYVFTKPSSGWANMTQTAKLTASDGAASDNFGDSVSVSGNTVVVGAPGAKVGANNGQGAAYVFTEPGSAWANMTQTAKLTASDGAAGDYFGGAVSVSGNTAVVGAPWAKVGANTLQGAAYVFTEPGSAWASMTQTAKLTASDGAAGDVFGDSVSVSGNMVVVGALGATVGANGDQGAAYVFTEPGSAWANMTQTAKLAASDGAAGDYFGKSVSVSGNTVAVGAFEAKVGANGGQGAAYVAVNVPTFVLTAPASGAFTVGQTVPIQWTAGNVGAGSTICLCYDTGTSFSNATWITFSQAAANGNGSYNWNTTGVAPGTYYIGGYLWSGGKPTYSHLTQSITIQAAAPTFALTGATSGTFIVGQSSIPIQWTAGNFSAGSSINLCLDSDTVFNGNETWIKYGVTATNGAGSYNWNVSGVPTGKYYIGGYLYSGGKPYYSHLTGAITIAAALTLAAPAFAPPAQPTTAGAAVPAAAEVLDNQNELTPIVNEAIQRWASVVGSQALAGVSFQIADLPGNLLGEEIGKTILIDRDAAGYGWFIDPTPQDDAEFTQLAANVLVAKPQTAAAGHADLLTTVMHELGHELGYADDAIGDLMNATLPLGVRRLPAT